MSHHWRFYTLPEDQIKMFGQADSDQVDAFLEALEEFDEDLEDFDYDLTEEEYEALEEDAQTLARRVMKTCLEKGLSYSHFQTVREKAMLDWLIVVMDELEDVLDIEGGDEEQEANPLHYGEMMAYSSPVPEAKQPDDWPELFDPATRQVAQVKAQYPYYAEAEKRGLHLYKYFFSEGRRLGEHKTGCRYMLLSPEEAGQLCKEMTPIIEAAEKAGESELSYIFRENILELFKEAAADNLFILGIVG